MSFYRAVSISLLAIIEILFHICLTHVSLNSAIKLLIFFSLKLSRARSFAFDACSRSICHFLFCNFLFLPFNFLFRYILILMLCESPVVLCLEEILDDAISIFLHAMNEVVKLAVIKKLRALFDRPYETKEQKNSFCMTNRTQKIKSSSSCLCSNVRYPTWTHSHSADSPVCLTKK